MNEQKILEATAHRQLNGLVANGYLLLCYSGLFCSAVKKIGDMDRYVTLEYKQGSWVVLNQ